MNKIWLWIIMFFTSPKPLVQRIKEIGTAIQDKPISDRNFLLTLKKAKQEAVDPQISEELKISIQSKFGELLAALYKTALINKSDVIVIAKHEVARAGIVLPEKDGWLIAKTYIVNYLNSLGIKAGFYSDYIDVRASDVSKLIDSLPDSFTAEEPKEQVPPYSEGIYR